MRRKEEKNTIIEICPVRNVIARFGNKWALLVILILSENKVLRFSELKKMIPDVSSRMLSSTLRTLEADAGKPEGVSRGTAQSRIQSDGNRTFAGSLHRPAD